jgi:hypothetical protein
MVSSISNAGPAVWTCFSTRSRWCLKTAQCGTAKIAAVSDLSAEALETSAWPFRCEQTIGGVTDRITRKDGKQYGQKHAESP